MDNQFWFHKKPGVVPPLDPDFRPASLANRQFQAELSAEKSKVPVAIALEAEDGAVSTCSTAVFDESSPKAQANFPYIERIVKFLLWQRGGWRIVFGGPKALGERLLKDYSKGGARAFDADLMAEVYAKPFEVIATSADKVPAEKLRAKPLGRHLDGCRIGFDLGASDRKVAAVKDGNPVFSEEVVWNPREQSDPQYHHDEIMAALKKAASYLPRVDAIGGSSAGVYVNNSVRVASLFRGIPRDLFETRTRNLFYDLKKEWGGIPFDVINDGEVTALAGSMSLGVNKVLGIAMGSSLAAGYVDAQGNITGWLDELAFAPVDCNPSAPADEWSGDTGCGVQYFSQVAVNRLARVAGIELDEKRTVAERLKDVQSLMAGNDAKARSVFETIGVYFGYQVAMFADFYDMEHVLILGRVTSGPGGDIILKRARHVLAAEFPELQGKINLVIPDEASRRVGQAIAAASLPAI